MSLGTEKTLGVQKMTENGRRSCSMHDSVVSDTGNNDFDRDPLTILRFQEPVVSGDITVDRSDIEELKVRYEGFSYDCEALGEIVIIKC